MHGIRQLFYFVRLWALWWCHCVHAKWHVVTCSSMESNNSDWHCSAVRFWQHRVAWVTIVHFLCMTLHLFPLQILQEWLLVASTRLEILCSNLWAPWCCIPMRVVIPNCNRHLCVLHGREKKNLFLLQFFSYLKLELKMIFHRWLRQRK